MHRSTLGPFPTKTTLFLPPQHHLRYEAVYTFNQPTQPFPTFDPKILPPNSQFPFTTVDVKNSEKIRK